MDTRQKNARIIVIIVVILGFVMFTQREAFSPDAENGELDISAQQNP